MSATVAHEIVSVSRSRYDRLSRLLHWITAGIIIYTMCSGYALHLLAPGRAHAMIAEVNVSAASVLIVVLPIRYMWTFFRKQPDEIAAVPAAQLAIAHVVHAQLYALTAVVLISGVLMTPSGYTIFGFVHVPTPHREGTITAYWFAIHRAACAVLGGLVALHVGAVVKHSCVHRNDVLGRML